MIEFNQKIVGAQIKKYRLSKGLSQAKLSRLSGVDAGYISNLERGGVSEKSSVGMDVICKIVDALGVSLDDIASTNIEYSSTKLTGIKGEIESELLTLTEEDIRYLDKIVPIVINAYKNKKG